MAKRPSLVGTGRQALAAATGEPPIASVSEEPVPAPRPKRRAPPIARAEPAPAPAGKPRVAELEPAVRAPTAPTAGGMTSLYGELLAFGTEQMRHSLATAAALSRCQTPVEVFATQAQYARGTVARFGAQALKLMQLAGTSFPQRWTMLSLGKGRAGEGNK